MNTTHSVRGRPINQAIQLEKKNRLMDASYQLLQKKSYRSISIREIAERADMQSAMISYYFGDKEKLFIALLERMADQHFSQFQKVMDAHNPIKAFIKISIAYFSKNTAITRLIADEVLFQNSALSDRFIELFAKRMAVLLPNVIEKQQNKQFYRQDVKSEWAAFSLMTLIVMPFIGASVRQRAWEIPDSTVSSDAWVEHIYRLFTSGIINTEIDHENQLV